MVHQYEDLNDVSPISPEAPIKFNFDELFHYLKSKMVDMDLIWSVQDDPVSIFEHQWLVPKLNKLEALYSITAIVPNLETCLEQAV